MCPPLKRDVGANSIFLNNYPVPDLLREECDHTHVMTDDRCPLVLINLFGYKFAALVDTGSNVCALSLTVWNQLIEYHEIIPHFPVTGVRVVGAFKTKFHKVSIQAHLTFLLEKEQISFEFMIVQDLTHPIILGCDFLRFFKVDIIFSEYILVLNFPEGRVIVPERNIHHNVAPAESVGFSAVKIHTSKRLSWPKSKPKSPEMESRFRRVIES